MIQIIYPRSPTSASSDRGGTTPVSGHADNFRIRTAKNKTCHRQYYYMYVSTILLRKRVAGSWKTAKNNRASVPSPWKCCLRIHRTSEVYASIHAKNLKSRYLLYTTTKASPKESAILLFGWILSTCQTLQKYVPYVNRTVTDDRISKRQNILNKL